MHIHIHICITITSWLVLNQMRLYCYVQVYSGYRFLLAASDRRLPVAILNIGPTRADHLAELKVTARCGEVLPILSASWDQEQPMHATFSPLSVVLSTLSVSFTWRLLENCWTLPHCNDENNTKLTSLSIIGCNSHVLNDLAGFI